MCCFNPTGDDGQVSTDLLVRMGNRIRQLRRKHGWTQIQLAERVGIDRSFLADIERGKRNASILTLALIAEGLEVTLSQLFSRL